MSYESERAMARRDFFNGTPGRNAPRMDGQAALDYSDAMRSLQGPPPLVQSSRQVQPTPKRVFTKSGGVFGREQPSW